MGTPKADRLFADLHVMDGARDFARHGLEILRKHIKTPDGYPYQDADNSEESEKAWHDGAFGDVW
jgi:hypothetical protein